MTPTAADSDAIGLGIVLVALIVAVNAVAAMARRFGEIHAG